MTRWMKFSIKLVFVSLMILGGVIWLQHITFVPASLAQGSPSQAHDSTQATLPWSVHLYVTPFSPPTGRGIFAFAETTTNDCQDGEVTFNAEFIGAPTPFEGKYEAANQWYLGRLDSFFNAGTNTQIGTLNVQCNLSNGDKRVSPTIKFVRRYYPNDGSEVDVPSDDGNALLRLFSASLNNPHHIVVMDANGLPAALPNGIQAIGLPYSFRASGTTFASDQNMSLSLFYSTITLGKADPLTLRIYEWDTVNGWLDTGTHNLSTLQRQVNKATTKFTTFILGSGPKWQNSFTSSGGVESMVNLFRNPISESLQLSTNMLTGTGISTPYTPTLTLKSWQAVSYNAKIPANTTLNVSVLSKDGTVLKSNVPSGESLSDIDPIKYPSLKLRVEMTSTSSSISPELLDWCILAQTTSPTIYLPLVIKNL